jgi:hypothetical protein
MIRFWFQGSHIVSFGSNGPLPGGVTGRLGKSFKVNSFRAQEMGSAFVFIAGNSGETVRADQRHWLASQRTNLLPTA